MSASATQSTQPWYREPWPWLLVAGPAAVVVAGIVTAWIAVTHEDGLVADDYYKQGLAINQVIRRDVAAVALGVRARIMVGETGVRAYLSGHGKLPDSLVLRLVHPTRTGLDRKVPLVAKGEGWYEGALPEIGAGRWRVTLEDSAEGWRLGGELIAGTQDSVELGPNVPPAGGQQK
jgi:hypothetical protein